MSEPIKMKVLIVHGAKPRKSGAMNPEFRSRLNKALELDKNEKFDAILISGGASRRGVVPETRQAEFFLKNETNTALILEDRSRSTSENIFFLREKMAGYPLAEATVIVGDPYLYRTKYLYSVLWPELKSIFFAPTRSKTTLYVDIREFLYRFYAYLDPWEKYWPVRLFKRFSRQ